ncbi:MAG TPA: PepSY domain-containing protein [Bryobacteraceae bacterium]|nr:PepSY domain-containing protein [Bryobacteraceae bacterium]
MYNFPTLALKKIAIFAHRWTGAAFCLLFSWWFISGIFMMYCDYPEVKESDRLAHGKAIDAARIHLAPEETWAKLTSPGEPDEARLAMFDGRPVYWFSIGRSNKGVYADNGQVQNAFSAEVSLRTASDWARLPAAAAKLDPVTSVDQWTVGGIYNRYSPLTRYSWPDGEQVYVSGRTGQVVQYTTRASRLGAWLGPIPHWLYFTPLRANGRLWSRIVIWLSGAATAVAILGLIAGLTMYSPAKRYRLSGRPTSIPYAGPKRLHMILGFFFGLMACTWAFSGMLSMDPFPADDGGGSRTTLQIADALGGEPFSFEAFRAKGPREALEQLGSSLPVKQLEFAMIVGEPYYLAMQDEGHSRVVPVNGLPQNQFSTERLRDFVMNARQSPGVAQAELLNAYDAYYLDRHHESPLPVLRLRMKDPERTILYIDPRSAKIVASYSSPEWIERWLYHGFHSINLPWLYNHRPAWDIVVLSLMLGGTSLCITSLILGWRLLRRMAIARV